MRFMSYCKRRLPLAVLMLALAACSTPPTPATYAQELPILDLQQYFNGTLDAHGIFQDRSGKVVKRFTVVMRASWVGETGTLDEDFTYSDGSRQRRVWTLRKTAPGRFTGTAPDDTTKASQLITTAGLLIKKARLLTATAAAPLHQSP